jgi:RecA/RadA recombinase
MTPASDVSEALSALQARWGAAAPRRGGELGLVVEGALARVSMPVEPEPDALPDGRFVPTGFAALDAMLGTGGLPRSATVAVRGDVSSGKTTLALRAAAAAQATGAIVAWLDLARAFDPVEAVTRGVRPEWLVVLTPLDLEEALSLAAALLSARTVDLLVMDLPDGRDPATAGVRVGDRLGRLAALARRAGTLLLLVEPNTLGPGLSAALQEACGLRLDLVRTGWIRLGRDVVGQRSRATVVRNRHGPPGRHAELEIRYAEGGARDACLARDELLDGRPSGAPPGITGSSPMPTRLEGPPASIDDHAPASSGLAEPAAPPGPVPPRVTGERHLHLVATRPDRPRRTALDGRDGGRRGPARTGARRAPRDPARGCPPARARGDLPRPRP